MREFPLKNHFCNSWIIRAANPDWVRETHCETTARLFFSAGHDVVLASQYLAEINKKEGK